MEESLTSLGYRLIPTTVMRGDMTPGFRLVHVYVILLELLSLSHPLGNYPSSICSHSEVRHKPFPECGPERPQSIAEPPPSEEGQRVLLVPRNTRARELGLWTSSGLDAGFSSSLSDPPLCNWETEARDSPRPLSGRVFRYVENVGLPGQG
uniref:Uncharacterized protein n=1 Tax=Molossus molossus TaxID=27622 RepID=A0A7J8FS01_MOLMO|nr:hypothetical protein HJG59_008320 [Molossus molossus]